MANLMSFIFIQLITWNVQHWNTLTLQKVKLQFIQCFSSSTLSFQFICWCCRCISCLRSKHLQHALNRENQIIYPSMNLRLGKDFKLLSFSLTRLAFSYRSCVFMLIRVELKMKCNNPIGVLDLLYSIG